MDRILALIYLTLSLFGFEIGGSTFVQRSRVDGADSLYSRTTVQAGVARFECVRSASGQCHYTVFARDCAAQSGGARRAPAACNADSGRHFTVGDGDSRRIVGLQRFRLCVGPTPQASTSDCAVVGSMASR